MHQVTHNSIFHAWVEAHVTHQHAASMDTTPGNLGKGRICCKTWGTCFYPRWGIILSPFEKFLQQKSKRNLCITNYKHMVNFPNDQRIPGHPKPTCLIFTSGSPCSKHHSLICRRAFNIRSEAWKSGRSLDNKKKHAGLKISGFHWT